MNRTAAGYDALADEYVRHVAGELAHKPFDRAFLNRIHQQVPPGTVLDAGCGPGHVGRFLADLGREVIGIDISPGMIDAGRRLNPGLALEVGDMRALRFANGTFAAVLAFYSIIHFAADELSMAFGELRRVLRADGLLAVAFHVGREVRHVDELWGIRTDLDFAFFEPDTVVSALAGSGFSRIESTTRAPYDAAVEAQTTRCYLTARVT